MSVKIHHINCATMCPVCERLINGSGSWIKPARMVCHCLLIETPEALVLVDTGLGTQDLQDPKGRLGAPFVALTRPTLDPSETALAQIQALGYSARDVRHIVPTHLDLDHAGGLPDFPEAQVHVFKPELHAAMNPTFREKTRYRRAHFRHNPNWVEHEEQGESWFGFSSIRAIPDLSTDVLLVPLLGHTRGHVGVAVKSGDKWLLHGGDSYFHHGTLLPEPAIPFGIASFEKIVQTNKEQRLYNQARLRELARSHGNEVDIFCAHDPVEYDRLRA
jgi:glyoxylase-like metal-dependent hydrolase (beta-lactamase superfamily II)